jgi:5-methylcytosine-specific restriction endonuclease McrA
MIKKRYTYDDVISAVEKSKSIANVLRLVGLKAKGGNYQTMKKFISDNHIDVTHFTGQGHNVGENYNRINEIIPIEYYMVDGLMYSSTSLKQRLINEGIKEHKCENCNLDTWLGKKIPLELHHIDGNHFNNQLDNIQILCPNCHADTPNYRGNNRSVKRTPKTMREMYPELFEKKERTIKVEKIKRDVVNGGKFCECGKKIDKRSKTCELCYQIKNRKVGRPEKEILLKDVETLGYSATGRKYGVSDNAVRKWLKSE